MVESEARKLLIIGEAAERGFARGMEEAVKNKTEISKKVQQWLEGFPEAVLKMVAEDLNIPAEVLTRVVTDEAAAFDRFWEAMQGR